MKIVNNLPKLMKAKQDEHKARTNTELAELYIAVGIGINPVTLSHYKNMRVESINWEIWQKMVKYFGVPGHEIFDVLLDDEEEN
jgi:hypothetical protein